MDEDGQGKLFMTDASAGEYAPAGPSGIELASTGATTADEVDDTLHAWLDHFAGGDSKVFVKLLISNAAAGSVIGRGGAMVTTLQKDTRTRVQLSRSGEYFPGTMDRVLLIAGRRRNVITALQAILVKLMCEKVAPLHPHTVVKSGPTATLNLRLIVPAAVAATITSADGLALPSIRQGSGADVLYVGVMADNLPCANIVYRQVVIIGTATQQLKAITLLLGHLDSNPSYAMYCDVPPPMPQPPSSRRGSATPSDTSPTVLPQQPVAGGYPAPSLLQNLLPPLSAPQNLPPIMQALASLPVAPTTPSAALTPLSNGQFRMDVTPSQAAVLASMEGQQLLARVQLTTMTSAQLFLRGIDGLSTPMVVLQGNRELAELAQWMLLQELMPNLPHLG